MFQALKSRAKLNAPLRGGFMHTFRLSLSKAQTPLAPNNPINVSGHRREHLARHDVARSFTAEESRNLFDSRCSHRSTHFNTTGGDVRCQDDIRQASQFV